MSSCLNLSSKGVMVELKWMLFMWRWIQTICFEFKFLTSWIVTVLVWAKALWTTVGGEEFPTIFTIAQGVWGLQSTNHNMEIRGCKKYAEMILFEHAIYTLHALSHIKFQELSLKEFKRWKKLITEQERSFL